MTSRTSAGVRAGPIRRYPTMPEEQELFVIDYPARQPQELRRKDLRRSIDDALVQD